MQLACAQVNYKVSTRSLIHSMRAPLDTFWDLGLGRSGCAAFLQRVRETPFYRGQIVHTHVTPAAPPRYVQLSCDLAPAVGAALRASGVEQLYAHQAAAIASIVDLVVT